MENRLRSQPPVIANAMPAPLHGAQELCTSNVGRESKLRKICQPTLGGLSKDSAKPQAWGTKMA